MKPKRKVLENGVRVVVVPMEDNPTVTALVMTEAGSHYETKSNNGISHFLEHMVFKGTPRRPSALLINHELDALGAQTNAFTSYECTGYWAKSRAKNFSRIFDVVSDMYLHPLLPESDLRRERGVIIEEINMYEDRPMDNVYRVFDELLYKGQPAGRSVIGFKSNIRSLKRDDFVSYRSKHYVPKKTALIVAGGIDPGVVFKEVERQFKTMAGGVHIRKKKVIDSQRSSAILAKSKRSDQSHFILGFRSFPASDKRSTTSELLATILGAGMSSRLFQKLREEMGVCYYVRAESELNSDHGKFYIRSGVANNRVHEVLEAVLHELRLLKSDKVPISEFRKAQEFLMGNFMMGIESSHSQAMYYGEQEILRRKLKTPQDVVSEIRSVTPGQVQRLAKTIFQNRSMNLAIVGPTRNRQQLRKALKL